MQACSGLRHYLDTPQSDKIDAAMTTSMFLGSLSFADATEDFQVPLKNWPVPFFWLGSQLGLGSLLTIFQSRASMQSMGLSMFDQVSEDVLPLYDNRPGTDGLPAELAMIFKVKDTSSCDCHHYLRVLRRLCRLLAIAPENELALLQYMQFVEGLSSHFVRLLNALDISALLLCRTGLPFSALRTVGGQDCELGITAGQFVIILRSRGTNCCGSIWIFREQHVIICTLVLPRLGVIWLPGSDWIVVRSVYCRNHSSKKNVAETCLSKGAAVKVKYVYKRLSIAVEMSARVRPGLCFIATMGNECMERAA